MMTVDRKFIVDAQVWKLNEGKPVELKLDERIFVLKPNTTTSTTVIPIPKKPRNIKISDLQKWIQKGNFEIFTRDQFFKAYPKQKYNKNLNKNIDILLNKKVISQFNDIKTGKERFKVNR